MTALPPRAAIWLLRILLPRRLRDEALDELADLHAARAAIVGRSAADRAYWKQLPGFVFRLRVASIGGVLGGRPASPTPQQWRERMSTLLSDARYSVGTLLRSPGFTGIAVLTLGLGIGASTAIFTLVNSVLLRPLPYADPEEVVQLHQVSPEQGLSWARISLPDFEDWRQRTRSFAAMAAYDVLPEILTGRGDPVELQSAYVTGDFFGVLGTPVQLGRPLLEEDARQASRSVVISDRVWRMRLAGDPEMIGSSILLGGEPYTVVGVMPASFRYPTADTDVWAPQSVLSDAMIGPRVRDNRIFEGVARLREGMTPEQAQADLAAVAAQLAAEHPQSNAEWGAAAVVPLRTAIVGDVDRALVIVLAAVGFLLLIGCVNLANLLLARGSTRSREIGIRTALGAGRRRIVRQLLTESVVLAILGGALGLVLSIGGVRTILALSAETLPRVEAVRIDARVIGFGILLTVATGLLFGLLPALRTAHADPQEALGGGRGMVGSRGQRLRSALVVAEVALAVLLVIGAGLMARSFLALRSVDPGFDPERVLTVSMQLNLAGVPGPEVARHLVQRREEILERVGALPEVAEVGMINAFPLRDEGTPFEFTRAGGSGARYGSPLRADAQYISPGYIRAMGIPLFRGSPLPDRMDWDPPVAMLVNETAARRFWPDENPVGRVVDAGWTTAVVTGIVGDVRQLGLDQEAPAAVYLPQTIAPRLLATIVVRAAGDPLALAGAIRQVVHEVDPNQPIRSIATLGQVVAESIGRDRFFTLIFGIFGGLALMLAAVGIYGVLAYSVGQRTREIGVRMALGAPATGVLGMVIGNGMLLVGAGVALGTVAALLLSRVLESLLYGISATDPVAFVAAIGFLVTIALLASYIPARRATRVDPMIALRAE